MQELIAAIEDESTLTISYDENLARMNRILSEFKSEGMQMIIFKHKEDDD
jgi:hypothetical protein